MEHEKAIKEILGIDDRIRLYAIEKYEKKKKTFYRFTGWDTYKKKMVKVHIPRKLEKEIFSLWKEHQKEKQQLKALEQEVKALLEKYKDAEKIKEVLERIAQESITKTASSHALKTYTDKAKELFKKFEKDLINLYKEGVLKRLTILQVLYLLANLKEMSEEQKNPQFLFKKGISTIIKVAKNERIPNPFGTLKNDFFLSGTQTPYDFLLSSFLEEVLEETLRELLEKEIEKIEAERRAKEYEEKMEKIKEIVEWFESLPHKIKQTAKEVISQNTVEVAEKILKDMEDGNFSLKEVQDYLEKSTRENLVDYFRYLKNL
ncbi:hypothetical protein [Aquifex aeolicus]|uniref:Uncharacterized protein aq_aa07 n=1 Tax=Aquifex aeolicus (strain VF5) TaxID=224324 RepID=YZ07_AQUAE|nr:hypothetical protein [Aquifex aeolicus]O66402.1 RecName: Full=Uncharacterized protein aq_aa07 [Aquifex aeolicus VF5]AAC07954.1 putative protein [Aquifex aeolicus VF5]